MTTFEKLSQSYSGIDLQSLSEKSHEQLLTMLIKIIQSGDITERSSDFLIKIYDLAYILKGDD